MKRNSIRRGIQWLAFAGLLLLLQGGHVGRVPLATSLDACLRRSDSLTMRPALGHELMVVSAHPLASQAGCEVLAEGGSAADAAIAVQMVLSVVEPQSSGLAGGSVITYYDSATGQVHFYDGLASAAAEVPADLRSPTEVEASRYGIQRYGGAVGYTGRAVGVPGTVAVLDLIHRDYGLISWDSLFDSAVELAEEGFYIAPYLHDTMAGDNAGLTRCAYPDLAARYCKDGKPLPVGTRVHNRELAQVMRELRDGGAAVFYDPQGPIAPAIVERVRAGQFRAAAGARGPAVIPGLLKAEDFESYSPVVRAPLCGRFAGRELCTAPPPSFGGFAVLQTLGLLERARVDQQPRAGITRAHLSIEASRLAQVDRRKYVGDPDYGLAPVDVLLQTEYLDRRFALLSPHRAAELTMPGAADGVEDTTSSVTIVDGAGNALSMTTTINASFGAHIEARGMVLNNVQDNFTSEYSPSEGHRVNGIGPNKRPRTSMAPTLVMGVDGRPELVVGAAGGSHIPDYVSQTIVGLLVDGLDPQQAVNEDHWSGQALGRDCGGGAVVPRSDVEAGRVLAGSLEALRKLGHPCPRAVELRSGLTVVQRGPAGTWLGGADPRRDGMAVGY